VLAMDARSSGSRERWRMPVPTLFGARGWRSVVPLSLRCIGFIFGLAIVVGLDEAVHWLRLALRLDLPTDRINTGLK
jgi:hypothetical protein